MATALPNYSKANRQDRTKFTHQETSSTLFEKFIVVFKATYIGLLETRETISTKDDQLA